MITLNNFKKNNEFAKTLQNKLLFFLIHPFGAFLYSLSNIKSRSSRYIFFLFFVMFGYTFIAENEKLDAYGYVKEFQSFQNVSFEQYFKSLQQYFSFNSNIKDIYVISSDFWISRFTDNYHILYAFFATVFAYYCLKSFKFIVLHKYFLLSIPFYLLAFLFIFSNPIFNINGVRFWTASWIAVYSIFQIFVNNNKKFYILALMTPLIHASFIVFLFLLLIIIFTKRFISFWVIIYAISFSVSLLSYANIFQSNIERFPLFIQEMLGYTNETTVLIKQEMSQAVNWKVTLVTSLPKWFSIFIIALFIIYRKQINQNTITKSFLGISLIWFSFTNFVSDIPSLGERYFFVGIPLLVYLWVSVYPLMKKYYFVPYMIPFIYGWDIYIWILNMKMVSDPLLYISTLAHQIIKNL